MRFLKGILAGSIVVVATLLLPIFILFFGLLRFLLPGTKLKKMMTDAVERSALLWDDVNHFVLRHISSIEWEFIENGAIDPSKNYLVIANHQSWADILVVEEALYKRTGFSRYFIKKNLLHIPLTGWACRLLGYPYMYRFTKEHLAKHPEDKGKDILITRNACSKLLKGIRFKLNSFAEGTRFTPKKHLAQKSPFQYLLKPKAGGVAYALQILYPQLAGIIDLTIVYHCPKKMNVLGLFFGGIKKITVYIDVLPITTELVGDYQDDPQFRVIFQRFLNTLWEKKDQRIATQIKKNGIM